MGACHAATWMRFIVTKGGVNAGLSPIPLINTKGRTKCLEAVHIGSVHFIQILSREDIALRAPTVFSRCRLPFDLPLLLYSYVSRALD